MQALDLPVAEGVLIAQVYDNSPAQRAGIRTATDQGVVGRRRYLIGGDILTAIDGLPVRTWDDLNAYLQEKTEVGQTVTLTLWRGDQRLEVEMCSVNSQCNRKHAHGTSIHSTGHPSWRIIQA